MARDGRKDEAREIARYIHNASIIPIIKAEQFSVLNVDAAHLQWQLSELENDSHPASTPEPMDNQQRLENSLAIIAGGIAQIIDWQSKVSPTTK